MSPSKKLFSPIKSRRAFEEVSSNIKSLIFKGVLPPGERLPPETELAHQFNVSRHTIREALRTLELSGLIIVKKGVNGGPIVKDTIIDTIGNLYLDAFQMEKITLEDLTKARLEIEKSILNSAMDHIDESDIKSLQENIAKAKRKIESGIIATEENVQFHKLLATASRNQIFIIVAESISAVLQDFLQRVGPDAETSDNVIQYHEDILKAIIEKNRGKAIHLLEEHLLEVRNRLQIFIDQEKVNS